MSRKRKPAPSSPEAIMELRAARLEAERIEAIGGTALVAHQQRQQFAHLQMLCLLEIEHAALPHTARADIAPIFLVQPFVDYV